MNFMIMASHNLYAIHVEKFRAARVRKMKLFKLSQESFNVKIYNGDKVWLSKVMK